MYQRLTVHVAVARQHSESQLRYSLDGTEFKLTVSDAAADVEVLYLIIQPILDRHKFLGSLDRGQISLYLRLMKGPMHQKQRQGILSD